MSCVKQTQTSVDRFAISNAGEHGVIYVDHTDTEDHFGGWLRLTANTTFGVVGYTWGSIGQQSWKEFLAKASADRLLGKLFGERATEFDAQATMQSILDALRQGEVTSADNGRLSVEDIAQIIEACEDAQEEGLSPSKDFFIHQLSDHIIQESDEWQIAQDLTERFTRTRTSDMAQGFWDQIWSPFIQFVHNERPMHAMSRDRPRG